MLDRSRILALIPHQGAMCLLDRVTGWSESNISCETRSNLDPANPLRRAGRLETVCGVEYGLQAAALHGALTGTAQPRGVLASLRNVALHAATLDDTGVGLLTVTASLKQRHPSGMIYDFSLTDVAGRCLVAGRGVIVLPDQR